MRSRHATRQTRVRRLTSLLLTFGLLLLLVPLHAPATGSHPLLTADHQAVASIGSEQHHQHHQHQSHLHAAADTQAQIPVQPEVCPDQMQTSCTACCICLALMTTASRLESIHPALPVTQARHASTEQIERLERPPRNLFRQTDLTG